MDLWKTVQAPRPSGRRCRRLTAAARYTTGQARLSWQIYSQNRLAVAGLALIVLFGLMALAHPILMDTVWPAGVYAPENGFDYAWTAGHPSGPSLRHLLGTDTMGRDLLSRLLYATRATFVLALTAAFTTAAVSILVGAAAAYFRGWVDGLLSHLAGAFLLLPAPVFMVILAVWTGDAFGAAGFGIGYGLIAGLGPAAIVMRAHALTLMSRPYIEASRTAGGGALHIIRHHLVPHLLPLASVQMMLAVAGVVIADGFISWFGTGTTWNRLNWGAMIMWSNDFITGKLLWHAALPPALAISLFAAAFYMVSLGLQDVVDPWRRGAR